MQGKRFVSQKNNDIDRQHAHEDAYCPYIKMPLPECYCVEMNGNKINLAIRFCLKGFENCRIYRRIFLQKAHGSGS